MADDLTTHANPDNVREEAHKRLIALCGDPVSAAIASQAIMLLGMIDLAALDRAVTALDHADTLGPIFEPTMYRDALHSGRLQRSQRVFKALRDAAHAVQAAQQGTTDGK